MTIYFHTSDLQRQESRPYDAYLVLAFSKHCNLNCDYCFFHDSPVKRDSAGTEIRIDELLGTLERSGRVYNLGFSGGGDPLLIPNIVEACEALTRQHYVSFTTNLISRRALELAERLDPARVAYIVGTFHAAELEKYALVEKYLRHYDTFVQRGFEIEAVTVAYPPFLARVERDRALLAAHGIELNYIPFIGQHEGRWYPDAYTSEEIEGFGVEAHVRGSYRQGQPCNAGYNAGFVLEATADVLPCPHITAARGNIYTQIDFQTEMTRCPVGFCMCPINAYFPHLYERALAETGTTVAATAGSGANVPTRVAQELRYGFVKEGGRKIVALTSDLNGASAASAPNVVVPPRVFLSNGSTNCEPAGYLFNRVVGFLHSNGVEITTDRTACNTVIVNTCCVTDGTIFNAEKLIDEALQQPGVEKVIVFGCLAATSDRYATEGRVALVGPKDIEKLNEHFAHAVPIAEISAHVIEDGLFTAYQSRVTESDFFVMIAQGCAHSCSYCNIKRAKGTIQSRSVADIVAEARAGAEAGREEVVLLADDCGSYGYDLRTDLAELLAALLAGVPKLRFKLSTLFPADLIRLFPALRPAFASQRISYVNLPLQSGSHRVLQLMKRGYDVAEVLRLSGEIKRLSPDTWLYTHILMNFPTETRADFQASLDAAAHFDEALFIGYSENPHTSAAGIRPKVEDAERQERVRLVQDFLAAGQKGLYVDSTFRETIPAAENGGDHTDSDHHNHDAHHDEHGDHSQADGGDDGMRGVVQLTLTNQCQCNCAHCGVKYVNRALRRSELSLPQIDAILGDISRAKFHSVDLFGGEPTLRDDLVEIVRLGRAHGLEMLVETNAIELDEAYLCALRDAEIFRLYISLDDDSAEYHDRNRRHAGAFAAAVHAINECRRLGIDVHVSMVPRDRDYFLSGHINRFIAFCMDNGAVAVRILFPSYVGNYTNKERVFCSEQDELELLRHVDERWWDVTYVESEVSGLRNIMKGQAIPCPAKSIFCHITSAGLVMPCPYLPLVFGDVTRESIAEVFARMLDHPLMRKDGLYCPTRDQAYLDSYVDGLSPTEPFKLVRSDNRVDVRSTCNNHCTGCPIVPQPRTTAELLAEIAAIDSAYGSIQIYGGEFFLREDIFEVLEAASKRFALILHSNGRVFAAGAIARRLNALNIKSIKVPLFSFTEAQFDRHTGVAGGFRQTLLGIRNLTRAGLPVSVYTPERVNERRLEFLKALGVVSVSQYDERGEMEPLPNAVLCFGNGVRHTSLVWMGP